MSHYGDVDLAIDQAAGEGPVTAADRASHRAILSILREEKPRDPVVSEEDRVPNEGYGPVERLWVVDPLDGTREFIDRIGEFSVMVGLASGGAAWLGAVYQPVPDRLFLGAVGEGAWVQEDASRSTGRVPLVAPEGSGPPYRMARSRSHPDERLTRLESAMEGRSVPSGSAGTKCCLVAEGKADLYVHPVPYLKEWDTCAPDAVLRAAGGRVTDCFGAPLEYGKPDPRQLRGIFAAALRIHSEVAPLVAEVAEGL